MTLFSVIRLLCFGIILTVYVTAQTSTPRPQSPSLAELRQNLAIYYLEPASHMALAKYFRDRGNKLEAFYILEEARRNRFPEDEFNQGFLLAFGGGEPLDNTKAAEDVLLRQYSGEPNSVEVIRKLADIYISRQDYAKAKPYLLKLIEKQPEEFGHVIALAEVYSREKENEKSQALLAEFARKYPDSSGAYSIRTQQLIEKEPAKAKALLLEAVKKYPNEGEFYFQLGVIAQQEKNLPEAENSFIKAAQLSPVSSQVQAWVGRFFYKVKSDGEKALPYYLEAYLLDPHAYETEFVESRIQRINADAAEKKYNQLIKAGTAVEKILEDPNPIVAAFAIHQLSENWDLKNFDLLIKMMEHDDSGLRAQAMDAIKNHADRSFDSRLKLLLSDTDLRRRGLGAYIAIHLWGPESFTYMRQLLKEPAQLLRFDAVSALVLEGGSEGRKIALEHRKQETNPILIQLIDSIPDK